MSMNSGLHTGQKNLIIMALNYSMSFAMKSGMTSKSLSGTAKTVF